MLARLEGTNFRLPSPPPALGPVGARPSSITVAFGGVLSPNAFAVSATEAYALVPSHAKGVVDVTLRNLNDAGAPISGELATLAGGFTFRLPDLTKEGPVATVVRVLLQALKREVLENVALTTHTEYDAETGDQLSVIDNAKLPALVLVGPRMPTNRTYSTNQKRTVTDESGRVFTLRPGVTVDLLFTVTVAADHSVQMQNLLGEVAQFFQRNPYLVVGAVRYEMQADFGGLETLGKPSESNLRQFSGEIVIRGVTLDEEDMRVAVTRPVEDYVPDGSPVYATEQEASRAAPWPVILGSSANDVVTPTNTPADGVDFEQIPPGDEP